MTRKAAMRMRHRPTSRSDRVADEEGSTLPLVIFFGVLAIVLIVVVVASTSLYLERKRLFTVADGAALAASEVWSLETVRVDGDAFAFDLDDEAVHDAAAAYLADAATELDDVELVHAGSTDGRTATVTLRTVWRVPIANDLLPVEVPIEVTATARSVFH
ncbi:pilus assembly protein TadG-related protein [Agromyces sp. G08B096]|uniref:pilus assembly protein TadG-related protein n=1 Tax=Agromyces sp. G08B096 TaxID=3156399 RepID=UPI00331375F7